MMMNLLDLIYITAVVGALHLLLPASCVSTMGEWPVKPENLLPPAQGLMEEKTRLGSTPPSCHNKCNECNPCMAVQVPTLPKSREGTSPGLVPLDVSAGKKYSNYKPLGWKCRCGNHLFNP